MPTEDAKHFPNRPWTDEQSLAISSIGKSLLVSAAAGSGKTSVLAERCVHLVCDAENPCEIDELLVVTFTEDAAREMRLRVTQALRDRYVREPSERLLKQLAIVDQAQISTLHAFCARLLRQNFHLVGLDPAFKVMNADEARLLRREVAADLFEKRYDDETGVFQSLIDGYGQGDDARVLEALHHVYELLTSVVDRAGWIERSRQRIAEAINAPLDQSELGAELYRRIDRDLQGIESRCQQTAGKVEHLGVEPYAKHLRAIGVILQNWREEFSKSGIDRLAELVKEPAWPRLPTIRGEMDNKELAKSLVESIVKIAKEGEWQQILRFSAAQWKDGLTKMLPHAEVFLELVEQFTQEYRQAKKTIRSVDFADLERLALQVLTSWESAQAVSQDSDRSGSLSPVRGGEGWGEGPSVKEPGIESLLTFGPSPQPSPPRTGEREQELASLTPESHKNLAATLEPSPTARTYHRRFAHVLVDEYQDINEVQDAILSLVSRECLAAKPQTQQSFSNLFCVGDVKQSIYRFRLAEPARFLERERLFRSENSWGQVIALQANFRSRAPLLDAINSVFHRLMTADAVDIEYDATHRLVGKIDYPVLESGRSFRGAPIDLHLLPSDLPGTSTDDGEDDEPAEQPSETEELDRTEREAILAAREIRRILGLDGSPPMQVIEKTADGLSARPARFRDIVVLLRSMKFKADQFVNVLRQFDIAVHTESRTGYFESTEVRDMLALLNLLDNQRQDIPLATVLRSPLVKLSDPETSLACIRAAYDEAIPFHQAVVRYREEHDDALALRLKGFFDQLRQWRQACQRRPLADVIWAIYNQTGYLAYVEGLINGQQRAKNLMHLHERAGEFGNFQSRGLSRFLRFLEQLREESDLGQPSIASEADNVVRVISIHRSKGLEYPIVIVPDLGKAINVQDSRGAILADRVAGLGMVVVDEAKRCRYPSLASTLVHHRLRQQTLAEELRVLYVAMTRAREHLILIGTCKSNTPDKWGSRWQGHSGPVPTDVILGARTLLDWLGPVSAMTMSEPTEVFRAMVHSPEEVASWQTPAATKAKVTAAQLAMARLEALPSDSVVSEPAKNAISRLSYRYPWQKYSELPAAQSVTARGHAVTEIAATNQRRNFGVKRVLPRPRFVEELTVSAADRGTATHLVLQHLNFAGPCDAADVAHQIESLVERKVLSAAHAGVVDGEAIRWFLDSPLGRIMRDDPSAIRRELPVNFPAPPEQSDNEMQSTDPLDRVMVRGRIDVLILNDFAKFSAVRPKARKPGKQHFPGLHSVANTAILLDYKTDAISEIEIPARAEMYQPQLLAYRDALERIAGVKIADVYLTFLTPKVNWRLTITEMPLESSHSNES